jgi:pilus assembly protein Flp/PilA
VIAIRKCLRMLRADRRGATAIEYGLIVALIAVAAIPAMEALGGGSHGMWGNVLAKANAYM